MIDQATIESIQEALIPVAEKIGEGVHMAWDLLVWGQFAEGLAGLIVSTFFVAGTIGLAIWMAWWGCKNMSERQDDLPQGAIATAVVVGFVGFLALLLTNWTWMFIQIIAPEYATFKYLLTLVN